MLIYSWARPAVLATGKGRGGMLFLLFLHFLSFPFISLFLPYSSLSSPFYHFYLFSPFLWETTQNDPKGLTCRLTPTQLMIRDLKKKQNKKKKKKKSFYHKIMLKPTAQNRNTYMHIRIYIYDIRSLIDQGFF